MTSKQIPITAFYIARSIDLNEFAQRVPYTLILKTRTYYVFTVAPDQWVLVYSYGVIVLAGLEQKFLTKILTQKVKKCCTELHEGRYSEEYSIIEDAALEKDAVEFDQVRVKLLTLPKLEVIAELMAQSVSIDVLDGQVDHMLRDFSALTTELELKGRIASRTPAILKLIGREYSILESVIVRLSLLDKPDVLWDDQELELLFMSLRSMFELENRFKNLDYKLNFIQSNSELMLETLRSRRDQFLEVTIIVLIIIEILLFFYEIFGKFK